VLPESKLRQRHQMLSGRPALDVLVPRQKVPSMQR
jgi:hypothetical protein